MSKHTPGPWSARDIYVRDKNDTIVALMGDEVEQSLADARLIAAAPELLEALKELVAWDLESLPEEVSLGYSGIEQDIARAKAAIVKATGET
ncbi:MAG: hypothetical protein Q4B94_00150 [Pseudomonadota bacterium]|nr:hypothetical protein [Pseudomonadota bacterium]